MGTICLGRITGPASPVADRHCAVLHRHGYRLVMLRPGSFALTVLLALLAGIGPLSIDLYLPSLPDRSAARRSDVAGATHDLGLSGRLCRRPGVLRSAVRPPWPAAGTDGGARHLLCGDARLRDRAGIETLIAARSCRHSAAPVRSCWRARSCATSTKAPASAASWRSWP